MDEQAVKNAEEMAEMTPEEFKERFFKLGRNDINRQIVEHGEKRRRDFLGNASVVLEMAKKNGADFKSMDFFAGIQVGISMLVVWSGVPIASAVARDIQGDLSYGYIYLCDNEEETRLHLKKLEEDMKTSAEEEGSN